MGEVIGFGGITKLDIEPDQVLREAVGKLHTVIVLGYDRDNKEYFASSDADMRTGMWLAEAFKLQLLSTPPDE
jgi:hypothetical protein